LTDCRAHAGKARRDSRIRSGEWKYSHYQGDTPELYNLREDLDEMNNLATSPAHRETAARVMMVHAASPAVPAEATARVRDHAARAGWNLVVTDAGEFADPRYRANPVDRCYFCKSNLYDRIRGLTDAAIASGANLDDLDDYRPGLIAAKQRGLESMWRIFRTPCRPQSAAMQ
jgi:hypothetical protein